SMGSNTISNRGFGVCASRVSSAIAVNAGFSSKVHELSNCEKAFAVFLAEIPVMDVCDVEFHLQVKSNYVV
ncbi:hypothetical protein, partial [Xanthomonas axonopodis]|uniref:hypothetical protein n=1 Tax=Xanthomonas axonopodis TaxID=53413 RepID=UPI001C2542BD